MNASDNWWCNGCQAYISCERVTYDGHHDTCGARVEWRDAAPTPPLAPAVPRAEVAIDTLVHGFAEALRTKLHAAAKKYGYGHQPWLRQGWMDECRVELRRHLDKGDPRDVAAYCAFLWYHGEQTSLTPTPPGEAPAGLPEETVREIASLRSLRTNHGTGMLTPDGKHIVYLADALAQAQEHKRELAKDTIRVCESLDEARAQAQHYKQQCVWAEEHVEALEPVVEAALAWEEQQLIYTHSWECDLDNAVHAYRATRPTPGQPRDKA